MNVHFLLRIPTGFTFSNNLAPHGIGSAVGSAITAAADLGATAMTNKANKEIAEKTNATNVAIHNMDNTYNAVEAEKARDFNAAEAEKSRDFNADEAQKGRDFTLEMWEKENEYNTPEAQMQRLKEAGINPNWTAAGLNVGNASNAATPSNASSSAASGPAASSAAAPNLVTPTMQKPDIASAVASTVDAAVKLAKLPTDKAESKAREYLTRMQGIGQEQINDMQPSQLQANLDRTLAEIGEIESKKKLNDSQRAINREQERVVQMTATKMDRDLTLTAFQGYIDYQTMRNSQVTIDNAAEFYEDQALLWNAQFKKDVTLAAGNLEVMLEEGSWKYGKHLLKNDTEVNDLSVYNERELGLGGGKKALINLGTSRSESASKSNSKTSVDGYDDWVRNDEFGSGALTAKAALQLAADKSKPIKIRKAALSVYRRCENVFEEWKAMMSQMPQFIQGLEYSSPLDQTQ